MLYRYIIAVSILTVPASFLASNCFTWFDAILLGDLLLEKKLKHDCGMVNLSIQEAHDLAMRKIFKEKSLKVYRRSGYQVFACLRLTSDKHTAATQTAPLLKEHIEKYEYGPGPIGCGFKQVQKKLRNEKKINATFVVCYANLTEKNGGRVYEPKLY